MAISTNFSKDFYDKLGHEIVEEMVNWFNQADTEYRMQLRDLNDVNYARFEAKLDQRFAEQDARWERRFADQDAKLADLAATLRAQPEIIQGHLMKWMVVFWATTILAIVVR